MSSLTLKPILPVTVNSIFPPATDNFSSGVPVPIPTLPLLSTTKVLLGVPDSIKNGVVVAVSSNTIKLSFVALIPTLYCRASFCNRTCALPFVLSVCIFILASFVVSYMK